MTALAKTQGGVDPAIIEKVVAEGDLSKLNSSERVSYYNHVCESVGLNPLTQPFQYIKLNGKLTLYARRDATDQLRRLQGVSVHITSRDKVGDVYVVTATATDKYGRHDEATGAVPLGNLKGDNLANALMKAETKAKRRVTLSICGLGWLDESELETIPAHAKQEASHSPAQLTATPADDHTEETVRLREEARALSDWSATQDWLAEHGETIRQLPQGEQQAVFNAVRDAAKGYQERDGNRVHPTMEQVKTAWADAITRSAYVPLEELDRMPEDDTGKMQLSTWVKQWLPVIDRSEGEEHETMMDAVYRTGERIGVDPDRFDAYVQQLRNGGR